MRMTNLRRLFGSNSRSVSGRDSPPGKGKRVAVLRLRWVVIIATSYLLIFSSGQGPDFRLIPFVLFFLMSNVVLYFLPPRIFLNPRFDFIIAIADIILVSVGFYLSPEISSDFYVAYFLVIFLAGSGEQLSAVILGSLLAAGLYLGLVWNSVPGSPLFHPEILLRCAFLFAISLFYGYLVDTVRVERKEREKEHVAMLERLNSQMVEMAQLKSSFLGNVSHELRTPLNVILGYTDLIRSGTTGSISREAQDFLERIWRSATNLLTMINRLIEFTRTGADAAKVSPQRVSLTDVIAEIEAGLPDLIGGKPVTFVKDIEESLGELNTDKSKLHRVLHELISNAVKFMERGEITLRARRIREEVENGREGDGKKDFVEISVVDTGIGFCASDRERIFDEFRQLDGDATRRYGGLGLGLSLCRALLRLMGGTIAVNSEEGKGAVFTVKLPVEAEWDPLVAAA